MTHFASRFSLNRPESKPPSKPQVGGRNRWAYDTFTNWEFYPSPQLPILVYFKETQTKPEGQIHFFPVIGNPGKLFEQFKKNVPLDK